ncbi:MAG: OFA family MFS transporter, partial [Methanosarcinales archaeon]|nr:OFA family MFS transporter [Methanosarcinales archaeon]
MPRSCPESPAGSIERSDILSSWNTKGVVVVLGCSLAIFWPGALTFGFPGVMAPIWQEMFQVGSMATGLTIFFMLAAVGAFMFLVGRWQERYGIQRMIALGVALTALASVVAACAESIHAIYAWAFINGMASSFVYIPALTLAQLWHPRRKGLASGTVSMVFGLSAAIMSPLFGKLLFSLGYSWMNIAVAIMTLATGLVGAYLSRAPDVKAREALQSSPGQGRSQGADPAGWDLWTRSLTAGEALRTRSFWFLWITWTLAGAAGVSMSILATSFGLSRGWALESAVLILTAFNLTNGTGRLISGFVSDRMGRNATMSLAFLAAGLAYVALPWAEGLALCALLAAVVGFAFGTLFSVSAPLVADSFGLKHFGAIFGLTFAAYGFVAGPLGPTLS